MEFLKFCSTYIPTNSRTLANKLTSSGLKAWVSEAAVPRIGRCVWEASRPSKDMEKYVEIGRSYLPALELLRKHLRKLGTSEKVQSLLLSTESKIALVKKDLRWFGKPSRSGY